MSRIHPLRFLPSISLAILLTVFLLTACQKKELPYINIGIQERNHLLTVFVNDEPVIINYSTSIGYMNLNPYMIPGKNTIRVEGDSTPKTNDTDPTIFQIRAGDGNFFGETDLLYEEEFGPGPFKSKELIVQTTLPNEIGFEDFENIPSHYKDKDFLELLSGYLKSIKKSYQNKEIPSELPLDRQLIMKEVFSYRDMTYYVNDIEHIGFVKGMKTVMFYTKNHKRISYAGRSENYQGKIGENTYSLGQELLRFGYVNGKFKPVW